MLDRKLTIFFCAIFFILAEIPSALCISPAPIVYVSGDGSGDFNCNATDAALKINAALQFVAENSNYTTVYLKGPFTYIVNDTLLISSNTTLTGDSNVTIKLASNLSWPVDKSLIQERSVDSHDITVRGFTMDGNREGNTNVSSGKGYHNFITLTQCQNIKVYDMYLTNNHGNGFKGVHCDNVKFYNNRVYELGHDVFSTTYTPNIDVFNNYIYLRTNSGIRLYNSNYASLHDNVITSNGDGGVGIQIQKYGSPAMDNIEIYNNTIYRTALAGIWLFGSNSYPSSSAYAHVHHNRIYETGTKANNNVGGIMSNGFNALIENNVIDGVYGAGIVQNTIYSPGPTGSGYLLTVRNNIISNTRTSTAGGYGYGIYNLLTGSHSFVLQNNCLYNNSGGDYEGVQDSPSDIAADPQYANRSAHDYHLKSMYGRWDGSSWINDTVNSPCIDAGYSFSDYSNEPEDNGDRINIGLYGNSIYASKSGPSNPESRPSIFTEIRVTANGSDQSNPAIYNNRIVWQDARNSASNMTSDIYMYDLSTSKETQITKNGSWASSPAIYGDRIVWEDNRNKSSDIYMYDLSTSTETPISTNGSWQGHPVIYGDRIVWEDFRNGNWDIYMQNVSGSNETRITTSGWDQVGPAIYSDRIVWQDMRNGNWDIYMYNLSSSLETRLSTNKSDQCNPAIFGDTIVWQDRRNGNWDIYMYNLTTSVETQITKNASDQFNPSIYGDMIVWQDNRRGNSDIYMYAISEASETQITANETRQESPAIYDGKIVWNDGCNGNSDIYMCSTLKEEPELIMPVMPVANFSCNVTSGNMPLTVQFADSSENVNGWNWNFGDGNSSVEQNPVHTFSSAGNYTVNLIVSNENGTDSKNATINVLNNTKPPTTETNGKVEWGPSVIYDPGNSNSISMDNAGHCIEVHVVSGRLFYKVGYVNFDTKKIQWGSNIQYDTGSSNSITLDDSGHCVEVHVRSGRLYYRVGKVNFDNKTIGWET